MGMFFTHVGRVLAVLIFLYALTMIGTGLFLAFEVGGEPMREAVPRYFPRYKTSGEIITRGQYVLLVAVALGVLTEISYSLRNRPR